jgi:hypothetical protein
MPDNMMIEIESGESGGDSGDIWDPLVWELTGGAADALGGLPELRH